MLFYSSLTPETQKDLRELVHTGVARRIQADVPRELIKSEMTSCILQAARRVGMSEWALESAVAYVQRLLEDVLPSQAAPSTMVGPASSTSRSITVG